ncbi:MAG TPA: hypothetical protein VFR02_01275 [bacterium]|nr:hypothetical protein [bacterium]
MGSSRRSTGLEGGTNLVYIILGVALTVGALSLLGYIHHENRDIEIHPPHVEVR